MGTKRVNLQHLAIIPDGNRRWAKKHGILDVKEIYKEGTRCLSEIVEESFQQGVLYLTIWASSYLNLRSRPARLVYALEKIYADSFQKLADMDIIKREKVRVDVFGDWRDLLQKDTINVIDSVIDLTSNNEGKTLTILVGYDGQRERGAALKKLFDRYRNENGVLPDDLAAANKLLQTHSWTGHLPDVDLIIRTGSHNDPHNSASFLSFLSGESQLAFPDTLWPEFTRETLDSLLLNFKKRERRFGQ